MVDSASELDLESDASSIDGQTGRCEQLQRQVELLQQQNRMLKMEVDQLNLRVRSLIEKNEQLRRNSVSILAQAEREEEYISNTLQRQISELKKDKESLVVKFEEEEERLINELNRKLTQLQKDKDKLERTLAKEQEAQVNKLKRRIERLESESSWKQQVLEKLRRDKIELENALEQEQEALVNRLWKKMKKLEEEKRILQNKLENMTALPTESISLQNIPASSSPMAGGQSQLSLSSLPVNTTGQHRHSAGSGSLRIPASATTDGFDSSGGPSPCHSMDARNSLPSNSPRPPQSPMDLDDVSLASVSSSQSRGEILRAEGGTAAYVARLREEVARLRKVVAANQAEEAERARLEASAQDENARLRRRLRTEVDRTRALTRALSDSESSLDNEIVVVGGSSSGCVRAVSDAAATRGICRECGQCLPSSRLLPPPSPPGGFVKPSPRVRPPTQQHSSSMAQSSSSVQDEGEDDDEGEETDEDDERSKTPPATASSMTTD